MKTFRQLYLKVVTICIFTKLVLFGFGASQAALVKVDLHSPGDGLITRDTKTGLEWLNVTATQGLSATDVIYGMGTPFGSYITNFGFRWGGNINELRRNAGVLVDRHCPGEFCGDLGTGNPLPGVGNFLKLLGCTGDCMSCNPYQRGIFGVGIPGPNSFLGLYFQSLCSGAGSDPVPHPALFYSDLTTGHYLVRNIPDPTDTFTVNDTADTADINPGNGICADNRGLCTLRAAIQEANAQPRANFIELPAGTYTLKMGALDIVEPPGGGANYLTIMGAGPNSTIINGNDISSVFKISDEAAGPTISLKIDGVTISNGLGAIVNDRFAGEVTISNSTISNNNDAYIDEGVIHNRGKILINDSKIINNAGNGITNYEELQVSNCTINNNISAINTRGMYIITKINNSTINDNANGIVNEGNLSDILVNNSTISNNYNFGLLSTTDATRIVISSSTIVRNNTAGISVAPTLYDIKVGNTIIANNGSANCVGGNYIISDGFNLEDTNTCNLTGEGDKPETDPLLGALADNGGPTRTHALLPGSPAIDGGNPTGCLTTEGNPLCTDQRGVKRSVNGDGKDKALCDVGAYEFVAKGDIDGNGKVDNNDLNIILWNRNNSTSVNDSTCGFLCDLDGDGKITALDARKLVLLCTKPRCATD